MKISNSQILKWLLGDSDFVYGASEIIQGDVYVGYRGYGDYETYRVYFSLSPVNLRRLAAAIVLSVIDGDNERYFKFQYSESCQQELLTRKSQGIKIVVGRGRGDCDSFVYVPRRKVRRYAWYPWSLTCEPTFDLPTFSLTAVPDERFRTLWDNRLDLREPYAVLIGGYPDGLLRLARLLLDYANTNIPPEEIDLEIEGGFRGVGPCSYEARFERVDT